MTGLQLVGIAIIGKSNEPLYLFDCCGCLNSNVDDATSVTNKEDPWGFRDESLEPNRSLPLNIQLVMHAALDNYNELVTSSINGQMPVIRATNTKHYVGLMLEVEDLAVYGYVSATNIKFFVATRITVELGSSDKSKIDKTMKEFLQKLHQHYISYIMNPFCNTRGSIRSKQFDEKVKNSVTDFSKTSR